MSTEQIEQALGALEDILGQEKQLLLSGRAKETVELVGAKMSALEVIDAAAIRAAPSSLSDTQKRRVETIKRMASENAAHFAAVRNGVQNLIQRVGRVTSDSFVGAYGAGGSQTPFTHATGGYLKKI